MQLASSPRTWNKPFWPEDHDHDKYDAKDQVANIAEGKTRNDIGNSIVKCIEYIARVGSQTIEICKDKLVDCIDHDCSNDHARDTAYATNNHHGEVDHGIAEAKVFRRYTTEFGSVKGPRDT